MNTEDTNAIDVGLEAMQSVEPVVEFDYTPENALDLMEAAQALNEDLAEVAQMHKFAGSVASTAASLRKNGFDGGTESLVGAPMAGYFGQSWNKDDAEGTAKAMEAGLEGVGEKIMETIRRLIANLIAFFEQLFLNASGLEKQLAAQKQRIAALKDAKWKKDKKVFKLPGEPNSGTAKDLVDFAGEVLSAVRSGKFDFKKEQSDGIVSGKKLKELRAAFKKTSDFDCSKESVNGDKIIAAAGTAINAMQSYKSEYNAIKGVKVSKLEEADNNTVKPSRGVAVAASVYSALGMNQLKSAKVNLAILKNIK